LLRHAPGNANHELGASALQQPEASHLAPELVLGLLADAAGVEQDHVGLVRLGARPVARCAQHLADAIGVVLIHLAAEGDDADAGHVDGPLSSAAGRAIPPRPRDGDI
jgi:hypothetical protein